MSARRCAARFHRHRAAIGHRLARVAGANWLTIGAVWPRDQRPASHPPFASSAKAALTECLLNTPICRRTLDLPAGNGALGKDAICCHFGFGGYWDVWATQWVATTNWIASRHANT
jgi:hypothetical protein